MQIWMLSVYESFKLHMMMDLWDNPCWESILCIYGLAIYRNENKSLFLFHLGYIYVQVYVHVFLYMYLSLRIYSISSRWISVIKW